MSVLIYSSLQHSARCVFQFTPKFLPYALGSGVRRASKPRFACVFVYVSSPSGCATYVPVKIFIRIYLTNLFVLTISSRRNARSNVFSKSSPRSTSFWMKLLFEHSPVQISRPKMMIFLGSMTRHEGFGKLEISVQCARSYRCKLNWDWN